MRGLAALALLALALAPSALAAEGTVVLETKVGAVAFSHKGHVDRRIECKTCHHVEDAWKEQRCRACHGETESADGTPSIRIAIHGEDNKSGFCVGCHVRDKTGKAPSKCPDCHKKAP